MSEHDQDIPAEDLPAEETLEVSQWERTGNAYLDRPSDRTATRIFVGLLKQSGLSLAVPESELTNGMVRDLTRWLR